MDNQKKSRKSWLRRLFGAAVFCLESLALWRFFSTRKRDFSHETAEHVRDFVKGEAREVKELFTGKESPRQYWHDASTLLKDFFIPYNGNNHRPGALRPKSLMLYLVAAIIVKVAVSGMLFVYYPSTASLAQIVASEIISLANRDRAAEGLLPLRADASLTASALAKGQDMIARDYFAHDSPEGKKPWSWIDRSQYDYVFAGENLAVDFVDADSIHEAFMKSPSHRANILNSRYQDIGVAVVSGKLGGHDTELLVEFFGTRRAGGGTFATAGERVAVAPTPVPELPAPTVSPSPVPALSPVPILNISPSPTPTIPPSPVPAVSPALVRAVASPTPIVEPLAEPPTLAGTARGAQATASPSPGLPAVAEPQELPSEPIMVLGARTQSDWVIEYVLNFSNIFFIGLIIFLALALLLNIFIRIRVQHTDVILQSIAVLALITAMILIKFHFVERLGHELRIL